MRKTQFVIELFRRTNDRGTEWANEFIDIMSDPSEFDEELMFDVLNDKKKYASFVTFCASCIVGSQKYKSSLLKSKEDPASSCAVWFTPDDEAMSWLILENSVAKWNEEYKLKKSKMESETQNYLGFQAVKLLKSEKGNLPASKYIEKRLSINTKKLSGWDHLGVGRFKCLKMEVIKFRYDHEQRAEHLVPVLNKNGEKKISKKYEEYAKEATEMMRKKIEMESPDPKKRTSEMMCKSEQERKKVLDALYNDTALSIFSNVSGNMVAL
jgi:hypothetical protein